ncbi:MAG: prolyl oligopeptidase family serine peptidase [Candidatus Hydrogenedentes bacterium]|nr:prolyl oligopeptidase family serine peptidase [Candidatus Hydrogenedentota bacterium]
MDVVRVRWTVLVVAIVVSFYAFAEDNASAVEEFAVTIGDRTVNVRVLTPPAEKLSAEPALLLTFATDRVTNLTKPPYSLTAEYFLAQGHRAASFDLPAHGERVDAHGGQIEGLRNAFVAGVDPFAMLVEDGIAVIDECIRRGIAKEGRIAVAGTSRGGYMALRLFAGDKRIASAAGYAPVTDWRVLSEFVADKENADVAKLALKNFVNDMNGRHVFVAIGNADERVGTDDCEQFVKALVDANKTPGFDPSLVDFHLTEDKGHSLSDDWYRRGRKFVFEHATSSTPEKLPNTTR